MTVQKNRIHTVVFLIMAWVTMVTVPNASAQVPWHLLVRNADGTVRPAPGYVWDGDPQRNHYAVKVRRDLRVAAYAADGRAVSFFPAPGYVWVGNPNDLVTRVKPGLVLVSVSGNGVSTFKPAPGYTWDGNPNTNGFSVRFRTDLRWVEGLYYPAPGYDWVDMKNLVVQKSCSDITGVWEGTDGDLGPMVVSQIGCSFRARFWNRAATIMHDVTGTENGRMTVVRYAPGCATEMYGRIFLGNSGLWFSIDGTQGGCGLAGHKETRLFARATGYDRFQPLLNTHPRIVFERDLETHVVEHQPGTNRSPAMDRESAKMLKDVIVRGARVVGGTVIGGSAGKVIMGGARGTIIGGLLSPVSTSDKADRPESHGRSGGGGGGQGPLEGSRGPGSTMMR